MRKALLANPRQQAAGDYRQVFLPAPIKGWSTIQPRLAGDTDYASTFINMWAADEVANRGGSTQFATRAAAGAVKSLYAFQANGGTSKFFAFTDNGIYDVTAGGSYGAAANALTNGLFQAVNITNSAGTNFLWGVNGTDTALMYNGAAWSNPTITGVTSANLNFCWLFKRRIFAVEKNTFNAWFLPIDSIQGLASKFPIGGLFSKGGYLLGGCTWTLDGGNGPDDYCVFYSSEGEVAVYQGTDPTSANSFGLIGVFYIGKPAAARCWTRVGSDILFATEIGLIPLKSVVAGLVPTPENALSKQIWTDWVTNWKVSVGGGLNPSSWSVVQHPVQNAVIITLPSAIVSADTYQYVMNLTNGAWSRFLNWDALHFAVYGSDLYYAADNNGYIIKAWTGTSGDWYQAGTIGIQFSISQVGSRLGNGLEFRVSDVRNLPGLSTFVSYSFCGNSPESALPRWISPANPASNQIPNVFVVAFTGEANVIVWYGTDIKFRLQPGQ